MIVNPKRLVYLITNEMRKQAEAAGTKKAEIDVSGGIDSAVVAALACITFTPKNVIGVYSDVNSSAESLKNARLVAEKFEFKLVEMHLASVFFQIRNMARREFERLDIPWPGEEDPTVYGGFRSCLRAPVGRFVNRLFGGGIRQGTGNMDEDEFVRFYQKGGDGEVDANWIAGLYKSEVWQLAEHLNVPKEIIEAKPTPDLWGVGDKHNDEDELKGITGVSLTYTRPGGELGTIEWVSRENEKNGIITGNKRDADPRLIGYSEEECQIIIAIRNMEKVTRHKSEPPPMLSRCFLKYQGCVE